MMKRHLLLMVLTLCTVTFMAAQNTATTPWWTSPVVTDMVSGAQRQRIRQVVRRYRNPLFDARNNAQKAEAEVRDLLNEPNVSLPRAKPAIDRLAQARAESTRLVTSMSIEIRSVLTDDQWRELLKRWGEVQRTRTNRDTEIAP